MIYSVGTLLLILGLVLFLTLRGKKQEGRLQERSEGLEGLHEGSKKANKVRDEVRRNKKKRQKIRDKYK